MEVVVRVKFELEGGGGVAREGDRWDRRVPYRNIQIIEPGETTN